MTSAKFFSRFYRILHRTVDPIIKNSLLWPVSTRLLIAITFLLVRAQEPLAFREAQQTRLQNLKQLTFDGQNAEAYFSLDGSKIIFQSTRPPLPVTRSSE
jgi:hypothetical protein